MNENAWIILEHDGSYVSKVGSTGWETVPLHFVFTPDRSKAKKFKFKDAFPPKTDKSIGPAFTRGFSRGKLIWI
jgi:hypothetical protein